VRRAAGAGTHRALGLAVALALACGGGERTAEPDARGPHGGRWLEDGDFALELLLHEAGGAPEYRAWVFADGEPRDPSGVGLELTLRRLGDRVEAVAFEPRGELLVGDRPVDEPHSFDVEVRAREGEREHRFEFASYEGRVELSPGQRDAAGIRVAEAGPARVHQHVVLYGRIAANGDALAHLMPRFPGIVQSVHKGLGDAVTAGEALAVIESNQSLHPYSLRARIPGTVIAKDVSPGEFVDQDRELFVVADLTTVWVDLAVHRPDFGRLRVGQTVRVDAGDGMAPAEARLSYLSPVGSPTTQTLLARAVLPNPDRTWRPGLFVTAEVETAAEQAAVAVAASAIQRMDEREVLFLAEDGTFEAQPIRTGRRDGEHVEVLEGLVAGQRYVTEGSFLLKAELGKSGAGHDH
jgi:cobalt-zinc-cadmium efflux system membrane fusion protein